MYLYRFPFVHLFPFRVHVLNYGPCTFDALLVLVND